MTDLLPNAPREYRFTVAEIIASMQRELAFRHRVYERRVADQKMTRAEADKRIAQQVAIIGILQAHALGKMFKAPAP